MYREVTMIEVREVLRLRGEGLPKKRIAAQLGLDPKTVRRYLTAAATAGVRVTTTVSDEEVRQVLLALHPAGGRPRGDGWARCLEQRALIERWLGDRIRLTKIPKLLVRQGVAIAYPTLHRFAVLELQFGKTATTIPVLDGEPGHELQVDTGWVGWLTRPQGKKRRFRAWIFTAVRSRHRFVYPTFEETTARAIEACEAAWEFFGGIFKVLIPDNTKAIIIAADPLAPTTVRVITGTEEIARHARSYDTGHVIEQEAHIAGLVAATRQHNPSSARDRLRLAIPAVATLLERLAARGESLRVHTARLVALLDDYGPQELSAAIARALERDALGAGAIAHILESRRRQRGLKPPIPIALPDHPGVRDLDVTPHRLETDDELTRSDSDDAE